MDLYIGLGDLCAKTIFNIVETLSINIVIGTDFVDKIVKSIHLTRSWLKLLPSTSIAMFSNGPSEKRAVATKLPQQDKERHDSNHT